ncbi:MAG: hypothetical protein LCH52_03795 [Bacteroidetes bacterium]|nr:hypothetical protein [Bacteroidota bacterium]
MTLFEHVKGVEEMSKAHAKAVNSAINRAVTSTRTFITKEIKREQQFTFPIKYIKIRKSNPNTLNASLWISTKTKLSHKFFGAKQNTKGVQFRKPYSHGDYKINKIYPSAFIPKTLSENENDGQMAFRRTGKTSYPIEIVAKTPPITAFVESVDENKVRDSYLTNFKKRYEYEQSKLNQKYANKLIESTVHIKM